MSLPLQATVFLSEYGTHKNTYLVEVENAWKVGSTEGRLLAVGSCPAVEGTVAQSLRGSITNTGSAEAVCPGRRQGLQRGVSDQESLKSVGHAPVFLGLGNFPSDQVESVGLGLHSMLVQV